MLARHDRLCRTVHTVENGIGSSRGLLQFDHSRLLESGDIYQFGVFRGDSLSRLISIYDTSSAWGFDTFTGLPPEASGEAKVSSWTSGIFDVGGEVGAARIAKTIGLTRGELIPGLFNASLTPKLAAAKGMQPAAYVDIDSDLFVSAYQALDWLFTHNLAVRGTVIGYDDFWVLPCIRRSPEALLFGEGKAHEQIARKHGVRFRCICGPCAPRNSEHWGWRPYFLVEEIGVAAPDHGVHGIDARTFLNTSRNCLKTWARDAHYTQAHTQSYRS